MLLSRGHSELFCPGSLSLASFYWRGGKKKKKPTIYFLKLHLQLLKDKTSPWDCGRFQTLPPAQAEKAVFSPVSARYEAVGNTSGTEAQAKMLPSGAGLLRRKIAARNVIT